jgi:hypothetical protein
MIKANRFPADALRRSIVDQRWRRRVLNPRKVYTPVSCNVQRPRPVRKNPWREPVTEFLGYPRGGGKRTCMWYSWPGYEMTTPAGPCNPVE